MSGVLSHLSADSHCLLHGICYFQTHDLFPFLLHLYLETSQNRLNIFPGQEPSIPISLARGLHLLHPQFSYRKTTETVHSKFYQGTSVFFQWRVNWKSRESTKKWWLCIKFCDISEEQKKEDVVVKLLKNNFRFLLKNLFQNEKIKLIALKVGFPRMEMHIFLLGLTEMSQFSEQT